MSLIGLIPLVLLTYILTFSFSYLGHDLYIQYILFINNRLINYFRNLPLDSLSFRKILHLLSLSVVNKVYKDIFNKT